MPALGRLRAFGGAALCLAAVLQINASAPVSVYAIVDKVILEPNETSPERVQVWGVFSVANSYRQSQYDEPVRGYLYYKLERADDRGTRAAWADLKKIAGTGEAVGFGGNFISKPGKVRKVSEKPKSPDVYPVGNPVVILGASQSGIVAQLKAVPRS